MELRHLRYFDAVATEGNFGRAARRLRIAQPPLSRQIQALERELGFLLIDRSKRTVELTPAGEVFRDHAQRVLAMVESAVVEARRAHRGETGRIVIGYMASLAYSGIAELLKAYRIRFPEVQIGLRELPPQHQIDLLRQGHLDVGFTRGPVDDPALRGETVFREPIVAVMSADHPLAKRRQIGLDALARESFVTFPRDRAPAFYDNVLAMCRAAGFSPAIAQEAPYLDLLSLVAAGFGVSLVPDGARWMHREGLVFLPITGDPVTEVVAAWRADDRTSTVQELLSLVRRLGIGRSK